MVWTWVPSEVSADPPGSSVILVTTARVAPHDKRVTYEYAAPFGASECPLIPRNECSAPQSSLLVEPALLPSPRGPPMSMPLPSERRSSLSFWGMSSPLSRAHGWARRSPLSGGVSSHSEEWVLRSSELYDKSLSLLAELALLPSL